MKNKEREINVPIDREPYRVDRLTHLSSLRQPVVLACAIMFRKGLCSGGKNKNRLKQM